MSTTCDVDPEVLQKLKKFRFGKSSQGNAAFVCKYIWLKLYFLEIQWVDYMKIDREHLLVVEDKIYDSISLDDLVEDLPENIPRYIVLSYELSHSDGRKSYPLVLIYYSPPSTKPETHMLYASAKTHFQQKADLNKVFDIREAETLTDEWLKEKLLHH
ncbi:12973_t:CDS:2 [Acaulospora morrowiae]|uniref:12973_t:CDS:1 n=1 Tax=Acaulospora morrowiae TaxID=94023 RepID=A0A9N8VBE2_9GLOM|nr:12973_t:CDS:2 [Acaulospora morrowiae]